MFLSTLNLQATTYVGDVKITTECTTNGGVIVQAESPYYLPHTVSLVFNNLRSTVTINEGQIHKTIIRKGKNRLITLHPIKVDNYINYSYRVSIQSEE